MSIRLIEAIKINNVDYLKYYNKDGFSYNKNETNLLELAAEYNSFDCFVYLKINVIFFCISLIELSNFCLLL